MLCGVPFYAEIYRKMWEKELKKNIVFDVGNVLVTYEPKRCLENLGYDEETKEAVMQAVFKSPLWNENDRGVLSTAELEEGFVANAPKYEMQIRKAFQNVGRAIELMPHTMDWIKDLKARGYHLYIISNYGEFTYQQTEHKLKFLPYMDGTIFSYQHKMIKPDREIYELLLRKYNLKADECVFIDDCAENVVAAREAGFSAIQFFSFAQAKRELENILSSGV